MSHRWIAGATFLPTITARMFDFQVLEKKLVKRTLSSFVLITNTKGDLPPFTEASRIASQSLHELKDSLLLAKIKSV